MYNAYVSVDVYVYAYVYAYVNGNLAQILACRFSASRCFGATPSCVFLAHALDYLIDLIAATISLFNTGGQIFAPLFFAGLSAGWLLFFKFIIDLIFINLHIAGVAAGWLLSTYTSTSVIPREVFLRLHVLGLAAGWLLPL